MRFSKACVLVLALVAQETVLAAPAANVKTRDVSADIFERRTTPVTTAFFNGLHLAADLSSAAYSGCLGSAFYVTITEQINDIATDTQGFIGYDTTNQRIVVAMRGSTSVEDLLNDIDTTPVTPTLSGVAFPSGVQVMAGVYNPWASVHDSVIAEVKSLIATYPSYSLFSTGHSLGGSLTYLSYIALAQNFPGKPLVSDALAAFPIGNQAFANFGTSQAGTLNRGNNAGDGVPNMYADTFVHYGTEYYGAGTAATTVRCTGERDPACSAGDGAISVTPEHFSNQGVLMDLSGCGTA